MRSRAEGPPRTAIIGAGATGLRLAFELARRGERVTVFEKAPEIGGLASSFDFEGTRLERFYHFLCLHDGELLGLIDELALTGRVHWRATQMDCFTDGGLWPFSTALDLLRFRPMSAAGRLRFGLGVLRIQHGRRWRHLDGWTARDWLTRVCGAQGYEKVWAPLLEKKFAGSADRISAAWIWGRTRRRARSKMGFPPREVLGYLEGGTDVLFEAMVRRMREAGGEVRTGCPVTAIARAEAGGGGLRVDSAGGVEVFPRVVSTIPFPSLLRIAPDVPDPARRRIAAQRYLHVVCTLFVTDRPVGKKYWVNVNDREIPFIGVIEFTHLNPMPALGGRALVYLPAYVPEEHPLWALDDAGVVEQAVEALGRIHPGFERGRIRASFVFRERDSQPVCFRHHLENMARFDTGWPGFLVTDSSQIFPEDRGVNNAFRLALRLAAELR